MLLRRLRMASTPPWRGSSLRLRSTTIPPKEYTVTLDNETLYVSEELARALGWTPEVEHKGVRLSLHGWAPR